MAADIYTKHASDKDKWLKATHLINIMHHSDLKTQIAANAALQKERVSPEGGFSPHDADVEKEEPYSGIKKAITEQLKMIKWNYFAIKINGIFFFVILIYQLMKPAQKD